MLRLNSKSKAKPNSQTSKAEADFTYLYANVTKDSGGTDIMKRIAMAGASFIVQPTSRRSQIISGKTKVSIF